MGEAKITSTTLTTLDLERRRGYTSRKPVGLDITGNTPWSTSNYLELQLIDGQAAAQDLRIPRLLEEYLGGQDLLWVIAQQKGVTKCKLFYFDSLLAIKFTVGNISTIFVPS
ncbi:unnamed protein product [Pieris macdunnoughi]|uniref:Uncharacterized protein n=1 Tax=Pieris macdunnoughi TaxID=345717 RepID=A0A821UC10_9NEOP|nr:unnamed protein product [Pieris macdunnoughi]